jgi:hypothetical protein
VPDLAVGCIGQHRPTHFGDVFPGSQACVRACIVMLEQNFSITEHTLPVLIESCRANCHVVMRRSARIMASARFNMSGVLAVAGRPARGRSRSWVSALPDACMYVCMYVCIYARGRSAADKLKWRFDPTEIKTGPTKLRANHRLIQDVRQIPLNLLPFRHHFHLLLSFLLLLYKNYSFAWVFVRV